MQKRSPVILPAIVIAQFAGTSLWFAGNAVLGELQAQLGLADNALSYLTSAVQLGFIGGTLAFACFNLADLYSPRWIFFACSILGALANLLIYWLAQGLVSLLLLRFATGFFLAGIYPVGMKIAASWFDKGLGNAFGFLVGALVLGTAFPHLLKSLGQDLPWQTVIVTVSCIAGGGGVLILVLVPDGPHLPKGTKFDPRALFVIFRSRDFRSAAFGYFGHMWELYTFWAFVPVLLALYVSRLASGSLNVSLWSFLIIGAGSVGCVAGGFASRRVGSGRVAAVQLLFSGICCLVSPLLMHAPPSVFLVFVLLWGIAVVGDSPQFSALNARTAPREFVGSALTIVVSIGFLITIPSIQFAGWLATLIGPQYLFLPLAVGPALGLLGLRPILRTVET